jgi:hypothetical protein
MRHFLLVTGTIVGNFIVWALITMLPIHPFIMFCLAVGGGCVMISLLVRIGKMGDPRSSAKG